jgi:AraC-like DNA-binding protein
MKPHEPRADRSLLVSSDVDDARHELRRLFGPREVTLDTPDSRRFRLSVRAVRLGPLMFSALAFGAPLTMSVSATDGYQVAIPVSGRAEVSHGRHHVRAAPALAAPVDHGADVTYRHGTDFRPLSVVIDQAFLHEELAALLGHSVRRQLRLPPALDLSQGAAASWSRLARFLHAEGVRSGGLICHRPIAEELGRALVHGLLLLLPHSHRAELDRPAGTALPSSTRRVTRAIDAQPERPFTVRELAEIGRVSIRTLQERFRADLGLSPMAYLRQVRLVRAHDLLRHSSHEETTVADIAFRCGFTHVSRFSGAYRSRFGVLPSHTLRYDR